MTRAPHPAPLRGLSITSLGTLASRVLGLARDMATASLLGLSGDGVMDAFVLAFRIPNLFRRLFGEGALAAAYLPVLCEELQRDRPRAWQFASVGLALLAALLAGIVVLGEGGLAVAAWFWAGDPQTSQLLGLSAVLLPYLLLVCLAAQLSATLQALGRFGLPALAPALLNVIWLIGVWLAASIFDLDHQQRAYVVAVSILVAGCVQVAVQARALGRLGFRWHYNWQASRAAVIKVVAATGPMIVGLAVTQINTLLDSLMAWGLTAPAPGQMIGWLGGVVEYPFRPGAAAAIYFAERLYQFPLGILGLAVATVIFPVLSRHAARGARHELGAELSAGLRLVLFLGLPASVGLVLLSEPLATLFFRHGEVTAADAARLSQMIACYGLGVWAFCAAPVLVRGYFARGDQRTPLRMAWVAMAVNVVLNLLLVWPLGECGLALSTSAAGVVQLAGLAWAFDMGHLNNGERTLVWPALRRSVWQSAAATAGMAVCSILVLMALPTGRPWALIRVAGPVVAGMIAVFAVARLLGMDELTLLWPARRNPPAQPAEPSAPGRVGRPVSHAAAIR
jgi:putative peptidoglycan lipid II flippase